MKIFKGVAKKLSFCNRLYVRMYVIFLLNTFTENEYRLNKPYLGMGNLSRLTHLKSADTHFT